MITWEHYDAIVSEIAVTGITERGENIGGWVAERRQEADALRERLIQAVSDQARQQEHEKTHSAELIHQPIPDVDGTLPRLSIEQAREMIMDAADKLTQIWDVSKANGWQQLSPAIDALITAVREEKAGLK